MYIIAIFKCISEHCFDVYLNIALMYIWTLLWCISEYCFDVYLRKLF